MSNASLFRWFLKVASKAATALSHNDFCRSFPTPSQFGLNPSDGGDINPVFFRYILPAPSVVKNTFYLSRRKFRLWASFAMSGSVFLGAIHKIVFWCAKEKMARVYAGHDIAGMAHKHAIGNQAAMCRVGKTVREDSGFIAERGDPISPTINRTKPKPAARHRALGDSRLKPLGSNILHSHATSYRSIGQGRFRATNASLARSF